MIYLHLISDLTFYGLNNFPPYNVCDLFPTFLQQPDNSKGKSFSVLLLFFGNPFDKLIEFRQTSVKLWTGKTT